MRIGTSAKIGALLLGSAVTLGLGCRGNSRSTSPAFELQGDREERVAQALQFLLRGAPPPAPVVDAHCAEERIGDGVLGPSDRRDYCVLVLEPAEFERWSTALAPSGEPPPYSAPATDVGWWPSEAEFAGLEVASSAGLLRGMGPGWVALDRRSRRIYVYSFST